MASDTPKKQIATAQALIAGTAKHLSNASITLGGTSYTPSQITTTLQSFVDASAAVITAHALYQAKVVTRRTLAAASLALIKLFTAYIQVVFANQPDVLGDFGVVPHKTTKPAAKVVAQAVVKRAATRKARNTMSTKAKKAITGAAVTPEPAVATSAPVVTK